jgi:hypothetical protein
MGNGRRAYIVPFASHEWGRLFPILAAGADQGSTLEQKSVLSTDYE